MRGPVRWIFSSCAFVVSCLLAGQAQAVPVVVDFNAAPLSVFQTSDYTEDGVTMKVVTGHYDVFAGTTHYGNIDNVGGDSVVSFDMGGAPFTLVSIDFPNWRDSGTLTPFGGAPIVLTTGGTAIFNLANITSFTLAHGNSFLGFDNITIDAVPEPSLLILFGTSLLAARFARRRA